MTFSQIDQVYLLWNFIEKPKEGFEQLPRSCGCQVKTRNVLAI